MHSIWAFLGADAHPPSGIMPRPYCSILELTFAGGKDLCFYPWISTQVPREQNAPDRLQGLFRGNIVARPSRLVLVFTS